MRFGDSSPRGSGELQETPGVRLGLTSALVNRQIWVNHKLNALAEVEVTLDAGNLTSVMALEDTVEAGSKVVAAAQRRFDTLMLLQTQEGPEAATHARRHMIGMAACALAFATEPRAQAAMNGLEPEALEREVPYAVALLRQEEAKRETLLFPLRNDQELSWTFLGGREVVEAAATTIRKAQAKSMGNKDAAYARMVPEREIEKGIAFGGSVIPVAIALAVGAISHAQVEALTGPLPESEKNLLAKIPDKPTLHVVQDAETKQEPTESAKVAIPPHIHTIMREKNHQALGISMREAFAWATDKHSSEDPETKLDEERPPVVAKILEAIHDTPESRWGDEAGGYGIRVGSETIARSLSTTESPLSDVLHSLDLLDPELVEESIAAGLENIEVISGEIMAGEKSLTKACLKLGLKRDEAFPDDVPGVPLLDSMREAFEMSVNATRGDRGKLRTEKIYATHAGGYMYLKVLTELLKRIPQPKPRMQAAGPEAEAA